ncbi:hypothetical protein [Amphritea sp. HPY]|uniref:hypothetical protein n=1 Tax=Amphritea sp. HPY TaxID=3421652 RepID=UPI003D7D9C18
MKLPTWLYESLPYFYLGISLLLILLFDSRPDIVTFALLLYIAGSAVWIIRSNARRRDIRQQRIFQARLQRQSERFYYPQWFYEEMPFIYIGIGLTCLLTIDNLIGMISGSLFLLSSAFVLGFRINNRNPTTKA